MDRQTVSLLKPAGFIMVWQKKARRLLFFQDKAFGHTFAGYEVANYFAP